MTDYEPGTRVRDIRGRKTGTITEGIWSGYVTVKWDNRHREETGVHIADIRVHPRLRWSRRESNPGLTRFRMRISTQHRTNPAPKISHQPLQP